MIAEAMRLEINHPRLSLLDQQSPDISNEASTPTLSLLPSHSFEAVGGSSRLNE
jgi:hypothetical protein